MRSRQKALIIGFGFCVTIVLLVIVAGMHNRYNRNEPVELSIMYSLPESDWQFLKRQIFPQFENSHHCRITGSRVNPINIASRLESLRRQDRITFDLIFLSSNQFKRLVDLDIVYNLANHETELTGSLIGNLQSMGKIDKALYFVPFRVLTDLDMVIDSAFESELTSGKSLHQGTVATRIYELVSNAGGNPYGFYDPGNVSAYTALKQLVKSGKGRPLKINKEEYFLQNSAFTPQIDKSSYSRQSRSFKHVVKSYLAGIHNNAQNIKPALELIRFLISKDVQSKVMSDHNWYSVRTDLYQSDRFSHKSNIYQAIKNGIRFKNLNYWKSFEKLAMDTAKRIVVDDQDIQKTLIYSRRQMQGIVYKSQNRILSQIYLSPNTP